MSPDDLSPELQERVKAGLEFLAEEEMPLRVTFRLIGGDWKRHEGWNNEGAILERIINGKDKPPMARNLASTILQEIFRQAKAELGFWERTTERRSRLVRGKNDVFITLTKT